MNPIAKYLFALSAMIVAWTVYAKVAVPFLEGPPSVVRRQQVTAYHPDASEALDKSHLPSIVPADAWELGSCKTLLTPQGTVYFEYWEPVDDKGTYQFMPFTIVINDPVNNIRSASAETESKKKPAPIVLRSLEGARLKFSKPLTARSKKEDIELETALLDGQVTLFRPAKEATEEDEVRIVMRNVHINRSQIFTLSDVHFWLGAHHGSGRNLSIELTHKLDDDSPSKSFSNIDGVEQMELAFVKELILQPTTETIGFKSAKGLQAENNTGDPEVDGDTPLSLSNQKTPIRLSCDGPFVFRMSEQKAWFRDNVVVTQLDDFRDNMRCESLQIELAKSAATDTTSIQNLIAIGSFEKPATIVSNSQQTLVTGEELTFDVARSVVNANGSTPVSIRSPKFHFEAPNCEYALAENGKLGALNANGPGFLKGVSEDQQSFEVTWERKLTTKNFDADRIQIDVDSNAFVRFDQQNQIEADQLKFLVWQLPDPQSTAKKQKWKYFPSQLDTRGNVRIISEKLDGTANELIANWPKPTIRQVGTIPHSVSYRATVRQQDQFRSLPTQTPTIKFTGDKVVANLVGSMNKMKIRDLAVDGSLSVESNAPDRRGFALSGQSMKLIPQAKELYRVTIDGNEARPATFKSNGLDLTGNNLQLDQSANTIWVQDAGTLNIAPPRDSVAATRNSKTPKLENAKVSWTGGMVFDGSKIYFENGVEVTANRPPNDEGHRSTIKTNSEALTIELTDSIRFEKLDSADENLNPRTEPEIKRMVFVNRVEENNRAFKLASARKVPGVIAFQNASFDSQGNVLDLQKLFVPMATVDALSGEVVSSGPGQALAYQYSNGKNRLSGPSLMPADSTDSSERKLTCVHVRFDGQLAANSNEGTMRIERNTRSVWANVNRFDQTLDPDRPDRLPVGALVLKSDILRFAQWTPRNAEPRQEMQAEGNTSIKSQLFEAVANRLSYNDATDLLVIEGKPPAQARLAHRRSVNAAPEEMIASKVMYRVSDGTVEANDIRSVEAGLSGEK